MGKIDLESIPTSASAKRMLGYVTEGFYDTSYVGKWIYQVMGLAYDAALGFVEDFPDQFFPETATWGLMYHEVKWGLPVRENLSYEERRRLIFLKRDCRAPMTPYWMEKYLAEATGFEVRIADVNDPGEYGFIAPHPNVFKAYLLGEGTLDSKLVHRILDQLKQSHTVYKVNDRAEMQIDQTELEDVILRRVCFAIRLPFLPFRTYNGTSRYDGKTRYDARRRYKLGAMVRLCCIVKEPLPGIGYLAVETRRNVQRYDGKLKYDGKTKYNAMIRKDVVE